jgi:hypothetical protein
MCSLYQNELSIKSVLYQMSSPVFSADLMRVAQILFSPENKVCPLSNEFSSVLYQI